MNWGAIVELIAAGGVIVSLIHLAGQIRNDAAATRANTTQLRANASRDTLLAVATSQTLAEIISKASTPADGVKYLVDEMGLDVTEATRLNAFWMSIIRATESNLRMPMSDVERLQTFRQATAVLNGPARGWWEHVKQMHSDDFVGVIDGQLNARQASPGV